MCRVRATGPLHQPKLYKVKLHLMRRTEHKDGTLSILRRPRLVFYKSICVNLFFLFFPFFCLFVLLSSMPHNPQHAGAFALWTFKSGHKISLLAIVVKSIKHEFSVRIGIHQSSKNIWVSCHCVLDFERLYIFFLQND